MEKKKKIKIIVISAVILVLVVIITLAFVLGYIKITFGDKLKGKISVNTENTTIDPYKNYKDIKWGRLTSVSDYYKRIYITYSVDDRTKKQVKIETFNEETGKIVASRIATEIIGTPKYVISSGDCDGSYTSIAVVTEEGNVYKITETDNTCESDTYTKNKFLKVDIKDKIIEGTAIYGMHPTSCSSTTLYFLTEKGQLKYNESMTYEQANPYKSIVGTMDFALYINKDNTLLHKTYIKDIEKDNYIMYDNKKVVANKIFFVEKESTNLEITGQSPYRVIYILTNDNKLLWFNDYEISSDSAKLQVKLYKEGVKTVVEQTGDSTTFLDDKIIVTYNDNTVETFDLASLEYSV